MNDIFVAPTKAGSKIKAINGNVFLKRDSQEKERGGIAISDGANVKSMKATVIRGDCPWEGQRVHVPHYGVMDMDYIGEDYAMCKAHRIFAIEDGDDYKPVNGYVRVRKCENDHVRDSSGEIALYMTENHIETTNWVEIIDVADDCRYIKDAYIGMFCHAPEKDERLARIGNTKDWCLHEDLIKWLTTGE